MSLKKRFETMFNNPNYLIIRVLGRFRFCKNIVQITRNLFQRLRWNKYRKELEASMNNSLFTGVERKVFLASLKSDGLALGLKLPSNILEEILNFAYRTPCFADREVDKGFMINQRSTAEGLLGKPILLAQYFNTAEGCKAIQSLSEDPFLRLIAASYLGSMPAFFGTNLWWTFPVKASEEDRIKHAHFFHRDVDDFAFVKFFFYLTDIEDGDGAHLCVPGSHKNSPFTRFKDFIFLRRWGDSEIANYYGLNNILTINGQAGAGFAEDTFCIHKGATPEFRARLLLQLQFGLFDHGLQNDKADKSQLKNLQV